MHTHRNESEDDAYDLTASAQSADSTALRASKRPAAAGSARLHKRAENYVAEASQPHKSGDKTLRRFTWAQVMARQRIPTAQRSATHKEGELCRQK
jgi:hypothetical protein